MLIIQPARITAGKTAGQNRARSDVHTTSLPVDDSPTRGNHSATSFRRCRLKGIAESLKQYTACQRMIPRYGRKYDGKFIFKTSFKGRKRVIFTNMKHNNSYVKSVEYQQHEIESVIIYGFLHTHTNVHRPHVWYTPERLSPVSLKK